ncbi:unnamed protein product [Ophioblennius macclurei]
MVLTGCFLLMALTGGSASSPPPGSPEVPRPACGMRGMFDGVEFHATYVLNRTNPPEYLREYYASFHNIPDPCDRYCNYTQVTDKLRLAERKDLLTTSRPVQDHSVLTYVYLEMSITSILNVKEKDQIFLSHIWLYMSWNNQFVTWNPEDFCGIDHVIVPSDALWKPDIIIEEMLEKDKTVPSPFLKINSFGEVEHRVDQVVMGNCHMNIFKFPFDIQQCTISFKSLMHSDEEIRFVVNKNTTVVSKWTHHTMQSQHEWLFVKVTVTNKTTSYYFGANQTAIIYTVFLQRRAALHVANFLLPIFFFLCMDLASVLIPDSCGEKISFRITVLLAVTVLQLILHEILPCSSDKLPLIAIFCVGIFFLMLISLLEAVLVRYLIHKDLEDQTDGFSFSDFFKESRTGARPPSLRRTPSESKEMEAEQPREAELDEAAEWPKKDGCWTRRVRRINRSFFVLYLSTATVFLVYMFSLWTSPEEI